MVIRAGVNIYPRESGTSCNPPSVVDCALRCARRSHGEILKALVEVRGRGRATALATHVKASLADFNAPELWEYVEPFRATPRQVKKRGAPES